MGECLGYSFEAVGKSGRIVKAVFLEGSFINYAVPDGIFK